MKDKKFTQLARRIARADRGLRVPQLMRPSREWATGLIVAFLIFILSAFWSANTYLTYRDVSLQESDPVQEEVVVYRESMVESALQAFAEREKKQAAFMNTVERTEAVSNEIEDEIEPNATSTEIPPEAEEPATPETSEGE